MGLSYFEDAEQEELTKLYVEYNWEATKRFFEKVQQDFQKVIENLILN